MTTNYSYQAPHPRRHVGWWIALAVAVALSAISITMAATGVISLHHGTVNQPATVPATFEAHGTVDLKCTLSCTGYEDIRAGTQVEILDGTSQVLAVGYLVPNPSTVGGTYLFTVNGVPTGKAMYGVHVGNVNRGVIWEPEVQVVASGFALSIGS